MAQTTENLYNELLIPRLSEECMWKVLENLEGTVRIGNFNNIKKHTHINIQLIFKRNMTLETTAGKLPAGLRTGNECV